MKCKPFSLFLLILFASSAVSAQEAAAIQASLPSTSDIQLKNSLDEDCQRIIRVASPSADTYTSRRADSINFGSEISMRLRGVPEKKSMISHLNFEIGKINRDEVLRCILKVYTVSKQNETKLSVFGIDQPIDENLTSWENQPTAEHLIATKNLGDHPYVEFDVTEFASQRLDVGNINFCLRTDSKKAVEISSRESGLGSELIIDQCNLEMVTYASAKSAKKGEKYGMNVLPCNQDGKFTIELLGVPSGGFGDLMIMNERGSVLRQLPLAIREGAILMHTIDYGELLPGQYWAVFRKGRVMVRDQFRLQPSLNPNKMLEIASEDKISESGLK